MVDLIGQTKQTTVFFVCIYFCLLSTNMFFVSCSCDLLILALFYTPFHKDDKTL